MTATDDDLRRMFDSRYLGNWDLLGQDVTVTIERVEGGIVEGEKGRKDRAPIVHLKGWPKPWVLNKTNMKTIYAIHGTLKASELRGKRVTLYATQCKGKSGDMVDCIRVRPTMPEGAGVPQSAVGAAVKA